MKLMLIAVLCITTILGVVCADYIACDGSTGKCKVSPSTGSVFSYSKEGKSKPAYSVCNRRFKITVQPLQANYSYLDCSMVFQNPQYAGYVYSFSNDDDATYATQSSGYVHGYSANAFMSHYSPYFYYNNYMYNAHITTSNPNYGYMYYQFRSTIAGSSFYASASEEGYTNVAIEMIDVRRNSTYIGMNTRYASLSNSGAGLCELFCSSSTFNSPESAKSAEDNAAQHAARQAKKFGSPFEEAASFARQPASQPQK